MRSVGLRRVYDAPAGREGLLVLVDRVWPRGLTRARVGADRWMKDVAPSTALRRWFGHDAAKWPEFRRRYFAELDGNPAARELRALSHRRAVTLLYSARDAEHNQATALSDWLGRR